MEEGINRMEEREKHIFLFSIFSFLGSHLQRMEVPGLGVESGLQLPSYAIDTAMPDPSHIYDLHLGLQQCINPLSEARDQTRILRKT